ncbi:hypothetical protein GQX74_012530 [Glossina fuscipes]|nr:hypothetical protein GQX74_012530 [Glossina fuscipes]
MSGLETPLRTLVRKPNSLSFDLRPSIDKLTISALFILSPDVFNIHGDFGVPSKYNNRFSTLISSANNSSFKNLGTICEFGKEQRQEEKLIHDIFDYDLLSMHASKKEILLQSLILEKLLNNAKRQVEIGMDVKDIQRNISLIRSPAAGLKERPTHEEAEHEHEDLPEEQIS